MTTGTRITIGAITAAMADGMLRGGARAARWLGDAATICGEGFAERTVERALKIQIGFLVFLALVAPFGAMRLEPAVAPLLLAQAGLTWVALCRTRRRDPVLGAGLYAALALVTFVEAKRYAGLVGAVFALEAVLALVALWYIVALVRRPSRAAVPDQRSSASSSGATSGLGKRRSAVTA